MSIPDALRSLATTRRFWTDFFWNTECQEDCYVTLEETVELDFMVTSVSGCPYVSLSFCNDLSYLDLRLKVGSKAHQLGWDDQAHWHPHTLRWHELDLICRAIARREPDLPHPGLPLLLLHRFAPICGQRGGEDDDAEFASSLLDAAWRRLGIFSDREIQKLIEKYDARDAGFRWEPGRVEGTWVLHQRVPEDKEGLPSIRGLYTLRGEREATQSDDSEDEDDEGDESGGEDSEDGIGAFPHGDFMAMLDAARETVLKTVDGEGVPNGILPSERPPQPHYTLRSKYSLRLQLPLHDGPRPLEYGVKSRVISPLNRILSDLNIGSALLTGSSSTMRDEVLVTTENSVSIQIEGDIARSVQVILENLQWASAPSSVRLWGNGYKEIALNIDQERSGAGELHFQLATYAAPTPGEEQRPTLFRITFPARCVDALSADSEAVVQDPHADGWLAVVPRGNTEAMAHDPDLDGWLTVIASDGGEMGLCFTPREDDNDFVTGSLAIRKLSPVLVGVIYRLLSSQNLALFPPGFVTSEIPGEMEAETTVVKSDAELHQILAGGSYSWWSGSRGGSDDLTQATEGVVKIKFHAKVFLIEQL